jgi:hypothetical protein
VRRWYHMPFQHWGPSGREGSARHDQGSRSEAAGPGGLADLRRADLALGLYNDLARLHDRPGLERRRSGRDLCRHLVPRRRDRVQGAVRRRAAGPGVEPGQPAAVERLHHHVMPRRRRGTSRRSR